MELFAVSLTGPRRNPFQQTKVNLKLGSIHNNILTSSFVFSPLYYFKLPFFSSFVEIRKLSFVFLIPFLSRPLKNTSIRHQSLRDSPRLQAKLLVCIEKLPSTTAAQRACTTKTLSFSHTRKFKRCSIVNTINIFYIYSSHKHNNNINKYFLFWLYKMCVRVSVAPFTYIFE